MICNGDVRCYPEASVPAALNMGCRVETIAESVDRTTREGEEANEHDTTAIGVVAGVAVAVVVGVLVARYAKRG